MRRAIIEAWEAGAVAHLFDVAGERALVARKEGAAAQGKDRVDQQGPHEFALVLRPRVEVAQNFARAIRVQVLLREDVPAALALCAAQALGEALRSHALGSDIAHEIFSFF